ncbi:beta family protein [uncultured Parvibaculum sp.]|uniref:beta family protein n=1 Tax=uncultured Parvibaculum sp. TaxID=291828 RepID=UPI0030D967F4|tara:strand:+ start:29381 stop:30457 length:1077 start_codon:yes stop_codon:yes gene_type:complete
MVLENKSYVPTLAIRASEMNALEFLPGKTKERMTPCILLAPWANSSTLQKAVDRVEKAFRNQHYFLDVDRDYEFTNLESAPQQELLALLNPANAFENWCRFVDEHDWVWPCVQTRGQSENDIKSQIMRFQKAGRAYCMRVFMDRIPSNISEVVAAFAASGAADYAIILEGGWTRDPLSLAASFEGVISGPLQVIDATIPIILSCTSIPRMFTDFDGGVTRVPFTNRLLIEQIARQTNRARIIYGDWGSTRPREPGSFANRPLDRVDYPTSNSWYIARNKAGNWDFHRAASAIVNSPDWDGHLGIWGEELIRNTVIAPAIGIDTPQKNVAARVNIHLHRQAFFGEGDLGGMNLDEDWED